MSNNSIWKLICGTVKKSYRTVKVIVNEKSYVLQVREVTKWTPLFKDVDSSKKILSQSMLMALMIICLRW